jgi:hypothetical protein
VWGEVLELCGCEHQHGTGTCIFDWHLAQPCYIFIGEVVIVSSVSYKV